MEFEFTKNTLLGEYYVKCSMGHEVVARWLQEEIAQDRTKIAHVLQLLETARTQSGQELVCLGREISLSVLGDEVLVQENALMQGQSFEFESEFELYDSESFAASGLDDFESLLLNWENFITGR